MNNSNVYSKKKKKSTGDWLKQLLILVKEKKCFLSCFYFDLEH